MWLARVEASRAHTHARAISPLLRKDAWRTVHCTQMGIGTVHRWVLSVYVGRKFSRKDAWRTVHCEQMGVGTVHTWVLKDCVQMGVEADGCGW